MDFDKQITLNTGEKKKWINRIYRERAGVRQILAPASSCSDISVSLDNDEYQIIIKIVISDES